MKNWTVDDVMTAKVVSVDVGDVAERIEGIEGCHLAQPEPADLAEKLCLVRQRAQRLTCVTQMDELSNLSAARKLKRCYEEMTRDGRTAPRLKITHRPFPSRNFRCEP